jgi:hypothetical protein
MIGFMALSHYAYLLFNYVGIVISFGRTVLKPRNLKRGMRYMSLVIKYWEWLCFTKNRIIIYGVWILIATSAYLIFVIMYSGRPALDIVIEHWFIYMLAWLAGSVGVWRMAYHLK